MVPDGGQACADIRWYCKDVKSCTQRWTAGLPAPSTAMAGSLTIATGLRKRRLVTSASLVASLKVSL
jgi:hypothetical protein